MSLATRLMLFGLALVVMTSVAVGWGLTRAASEDLLEDLEERGLAVARGIASRAVAPISEGRRVAAQAVLDSVWEEEDVSRVVLTDVRGKLLAERDFGLPAAEGQQARVLYPVATEPDATGYRDAIGMVRLTLSARGLEARRQRYVSGAVKTTAVVAVSGFVVAIGVALALAVPLRRLQAATAGVAEGTYEAALEGLPSSGPSEVRALGAAFRTAVQAVAERETELVDINQQLRETEAARDAMTHMVIHDLKGPIANVITLLAVIEAAQVDAEDRELVAEVRQRARDLLRTIEDQLDFARLSGGKLEVRRSEQEIGDVLMGAMDQVRHLAEAGGVDLKVDLPDEDLYFGCDRPLLERVIVNLLVNALKHGQSPVTVGALVEAGHLQLSVEDAGAGVPAGKEEAVFDRFTSLSDAGGAGLGLALVRLAAEAHGGTASVTGARFVVTLPMSSPRPHSAHSPPGGLG